MIIEFKKYKPCFYDGKTAIPIIDKIQRKLRSAIAFKTFHIIYDNCFLVGNMVINNVCGRLKNDNRI